MTGESEEMERYIHKLKPEPVKLAPVVDPVLVEKVPKMTGKGL